MKLKNSFFKYYLCTMFILFSMASCYWYEEEQTYDRTVLIYMAADNNLSYTYGSTPSFAQEDLDEMIEAAGDIPTNSRLIIYIDDTDLPRILTIEQQEGRRPTLKTLHQYTDEHNSGDAQTLRTVMEWTTDNYPSQSYGLVIWSHGDAWIPAKAPAQRAVCLDNQSSSWMEIADIAHALEAFPQTEFILFDACFMQSIEVAYELRHATNYIVASPAEIPAPGAPYKRIMKAMFANTNSATRIAEEYYNEYNEGKIPINGQKDKTYGVCLSVVNCSQLEQLAAVTQEMITKYVTLHNSGKPQGVQRYYLRNSSARPAYYDMNGYMQTLITDIEDYSLWSSVFNSAIPHKRATPYWYSEYTGMEKLDTENYGGISCYVPQSATTRTKLNEAFCSTSWYEATGWEVWFPITESSEQ